MDSSFIELGVKPELVEGLKKADISIPTEIQKKIIPLALEKKDLIAQSETGSGKTLAYLLPIFEKIDLAAKVQTIILAPTHELASQIKGQIELLVKNSGLPINFALIIGEVNITRQIDKLKQKPHIVVGSSGRILELLEKKKINPATITTLVIDEADRMLDKKNIAPVKKIIKLLPKERQTILVSASVCNQTITIAKDFMNNPEVVKAEENQGIPSNIEHFYYVSEKNKKVEVLRRLVNYLKPEKSLVFIQKGEDMEELTEKTKYHGLKVGGLFGEQQKEARKKVVDDFKKGNIQILFATDIAARGLDIKGITHVFNLDLHRDAQSYLHRVGRTGRQNEKGYAISIITNEEKPFLNKIAKDFHIEIKIGSFK